MSQSKYDREFKEQVVQRIARGETTITEIAQELETALYTIRDWVRQYKKDGSQAFPGSGNLKEEDAEIRKLRKELSDLKEENAILKKAAESSVQTQKRIVSSHQRSNFIKNHRIYGAPRVAAALPPDRKASVNTVAKIMRENGLRQKQRKSIKRPRTPSILCR
ncbi:hypothetical protein SRRS_34390 [Sporomusa rhizae]|uniref:transposase n=1 Tax=Sporomusa rhizae TaxID=357999 RepID=UPI00352A309D